MDGKGVSDAIMPFVFKEKEIHSDAFHVFSSDPYHCHAGRVPWELFCGLSVLLERMVGMML